MDDEATFLNLGSGNRAGLERPEQMARMLQAACPQEATSFAVAAREQALTTRNNERAAFWGSVVTVLFEGRGHGRDEAG